MIGFALIGGTIVSFIGLIPNIDAGANPVFWSCAGGTLAIIIFRNYMRRRKKNTQILHHKTTDKLRIGRSIKEHFRVLKGSMTEQTEWWNGLGEELETDIETLTDKTENS